VSSAIAARAAGRTVSAHLVDPACALCGGRERRVRFRAGEHAVVTCEGCDLTYVTPRMEPDALLERVYNASYWSSPAPRERGYADYLGDSELYRATFERRLRALQRLLPRGGRALDVGCGPGVFLGVLHTAGWDVAGIEPSARAREAANAQLRRGAVQRGTLAEACFEPASFDLVTLWDVLEHLPDPLGELRAARALIAPHGRLVVETQDVNSLAARLLGPGWHHYKHCEHLHHFHRGTLRRALRASGFEPLSMRAGPGGKYVRREFLVERSARLWPALPGLVQRLTRLLPEVVWVDLHDEIVCVAQPSTEPG
jgi:SAM-dependent methyltransferase